MIMVIKMLLIMIKKSVKVKIMNDTYTFHF